MVWKFSIISTLLMSSLSFAAGATSTQTASPQYSACQGLLQACRNAGFVQGQYKQGTGLWVDCACPLFNGTAQPAKAKLKLPTVSGSIISNCKTENANFCKKKPQ